jgi:hypothetical protein
MRGYFHWRAYDPLPMPSLIASIDTPEGTRRVRRHPPGHRSKHKSSVGREYQGAHGNRLYWGDSCHITCYLGAMRGYGETKLAVAVLEPIQTHSNRLEWK